jgi:hypothetical protein
MTLAVVQPVVVKARRVYPVLHQLMSCVERSSQIKISPFLVIMLPAELVALISLRLLLRSLATVKVPLLPAELVALITLRLLLRSLATVQVPLLPAELVA